MLETLTIITLSVLFLIFFRPGKTPPLDSPLVIERPGSHHMTLANKLNLAQPFIEAVVAQAGADAQNSATLCFEVRDKQVKAHGHDSYLLALTRRSGLLYCQAISPPTSGRHFDAMTEFAAGVLRRFPATGAHSDEADARIVAAVQEVAERREISVKQLSA